MRIAAEEGSLLYAQRVIEERLRLAPDVPELREAHAGILYLRDQHAAAEAALDEAEGLARRTRAPGASRTTAGCWAEARGETERAYELLRAVPRAQPGLRGGSRRWRWMDSSRTERR